MMERQTLREEVISVNRVVKVVAGGKRLRFRAVVVAGDENGQVGLGIGKALEVADAIAKATQDARRHLVRLPLIDCTIPHEIIGKQGASRILLKPAAPGTGVVAGSAARIVLSVAGVKDVLAKSLGSNNSLNLAKATFHALTSLCDPRMVARARGLPLRSVWAYPRLPAYPLESEETPPVVPSPEAGKLPETVEEEV